MKLININKMPCLTFTSRIKLPNSTNNPQHKSILLRDKISTHSRTTYQFDFEQLPISIKPLIDKSKTC